LVNEFWFDPCKAQPCQGIFELISDGIYVSDVNGKTLAVNRMYEQVTGLNRHDLVGRSIFELRDEGNFNVLTNPEVMATKKPVTILQTTKANKSVLCNGYPVFNAKGEINLVVTFVRDSILINQLKEQIIDQEFMIEKYLEINKFDNETTIIKSAPMTQLMERSALIAKTDATVLILGETGVGKGVLARKIHEHSYRCKEPFFKIDCSTISENLIESELFGYDPGAFSGANKKGKAGLLEMADKGTLLLDEIGDMPLNMQVKLLRAIQDQEFMRVGSTKIRKVDVRFIASTNCDLAEEVKKGKFRSDLYYRLCVAVLNIPPLRERKDDILAMVRFFLDKYTLKYHKNISFTDKFEKALLCYKWPGNVRQLENYIQGFVVSHENGIFDVCDLPPIMLMDTAINIQGSNKSLNEMVGEYEKNLLEKALQTYRSVDKVAEALNIVPPVVKTHC
jgi:PAS domain S-box-containing protein